MNGLSTIFLNIKDGDTVTLENKTYDVRQDDSFEFEGYYCSNTAKLHENPRGLRRAAIFLKDKKNIVIDGNGATVLVHGKMTPLLFDGCENITVKNLVIDYARPTMSEYTVLSNDGGVCDIRINEECLFRIEGNEIIWQGENGSGGKPYWEDSHISNRRYNKVYDPETELCRDFRRDDMAFEKIERLDDHTLRVHFTKKDVTLSAGEVMQTRNIVRDQTGALFNRCKNLYFENLRIKFMHGLGMVSQFCENVAYKNCDFTPAEGRTAASTADFFQFSGCKGRITVENCRARGAHDDYINVHGTHLRTVEKNDGENSLVVRFMHAESWGFQAFECGDELEFIKWDTLIPYAKTRVMCYERLNDTDIKLWVDGALPDIEIGKDVVENATWTPDLYVRNCDFGPTCGRGILCTTRGEVIIENNNFHKLWGPALLLEDDCNFWFESGYTNEVVFRNNRVTQCEYAGMWEKAPIIRYTPKVMDENSTEFVHGRLTVTGNTFEKSRGATHCFWLEYLREAEISGNTFDAPYEVVKKCVGNVIEKSNVC
ncbi:MAG: right-handed parallel beta-helix repeat-containing protein [Clostridia bacterium]|nr:right-handed parallel beta-helix repeat-containing protein [Clostridia bacterium]